MESQMVVLHFPSAFGGLSEIILHLANAFGGTSNTVCPISNFIFPNWKRRFAICIFHFAFFTLHFSQLTLSILQVKTWKCQSCYDFTVSMCLRLPCALAHWHLFFLSFSFSYARGRYALIGRFAYHVTPEVSASRGPARLPVRFLSLSHVTLTVLVCVMVTRLDLFLCHAYVFSLMLLTHLRSCRLVFLPVLVTPKCYPDDSSLDTLFDSSVFPSCTFTALAPLCTCIP